MKIKPSSILYFLISCIILYSCSGGTDNIIKELPLVPYPQELIQGNGSFNPEGPFSVRVSGIDETTCESTTSVSKVNLTSSFKYALSGVQLNEKLSSIHSLLNTSH